MKELIFATHNQNKVDEIKMIFKEYGIKSLAEIDYREEIDETAQTLEGNALLKANHIFKVYKTPVFADDSGLEVEALDGAPGVYSARYAGEPKNHEKNNAKLLSALQNETNRKAQFRTVIAYITKNTQLCFEGVVTGTIATEIRGKGGFGYDPLFIPDGYTKTFGELPREVKLACSHRSNAMAKLYAHLKSLT